MSFRGLAAKNSTACHGPWRPLWPSRSKLCAGSTTPSLNCVLPFRQLESPVLHGGVLRQPGECHCHSRRVALLAMVFRDTKGRLRHCDVKFALGEAHLPKSVRGNLWSQWIEDLSFCGSYVVALCLKKNNLCFSIEKVKD